MKVRTLLAAAVATALATMVTSSMASASEPTTTGTPYYLAGVNTGLTSTLNSLYSTFKVPKVTCPSKPTYPPLTIDDEISRIQFNLLHRHSDRATSLHPMLRVDSLLFIHPLCRWCFGGE